MTKQNYLDATEAAGKEFYLRGIKGEVIMLNLLKFKKEADYSSLPELAPAHPISGEAAYKLYIEHIMPFLIDAGGELLFQGKGGSYVVGPEYEKWDLVLLVKHKSVSIFLQFAQNEEYLKGIGHRTAALEDSRLLPIETHS